MADISSDLARAKEIIWDDDDQDEVQDFIYPFGTSSMMISARSQQGKTELIKHLLAEQRISPTPEHVIIVSDHSKTQPYFEMNRAIQTLYTNTDVKLTSYADPNWQHDIDKPNTLLILDDLMPHLKPALNVINEYVTQGRHTQRSLLWVTHNIFLDAAKTARDNTHITSIFSPAQERQSVERHLRNVLGEKGVTEAMMKKLIQLKQGEFYILAATPQSSDRLIFDHNFKNVKLY